MSASRPSSPASPPVVRTAARWISRGLPRGLARWLTLCGSLAAAAPGCATSTVLFTPDEDPMPLLEGELNAAESTLDVAIYTFTYQPIADLLVEAKLRGVKVRVLVDEHQSRLPSADDNGGAVGQFEILDDLESEGIAVCRRPGEDGGIVHHKFAVVDDRTVITGSYNFTEAATLRNLENLLVLSDPNLAQQYGEAFQALWSCNGGE